MSGPEITAYIITAVTWNAYIIAFTLIYVYYRKHPFIRQRIYPLTIVATAGIWLIGNFVTILRLSYWTSNFPYPCGIFTAIQIIGGIMPIYVIVLRAVFLLHNFLIQKIISGEYFKIQRYEIVVLTMFSDRRKLRSVIDSTMKSTRLDGKSFSRNDANIAEVALDIDEGGAKLQVTSLKKNDTDSKLKVNFPVATGGDSENVHSVSDSGLAATKSAAGSSSVYKPLGVAWEELNGVDIRATPPAHVFLKVTMLLICSGLDIFSCFSCLLLLLFMQFGATTSWETPVCPFKI